MKNKFLLSLVMICGVITIKAQQITVALQHQGISTMYYGDNSLNNANTAAQNGDTIYLPGTADYPGFGISKRLVIIGAGHNPDSTTATGRTRIQGDIYFYSGSDSSVLEGIYTDNDIHFYNQTQINHVRISRCNLNNIYFDGSFDASTPSTNCQREIIEQNIIRGTIQCQHSDWLTIRNNFISSTINNITQNCYIENNVLYYPVGYNSYWGTNYPVLSSVSYSWIYNNIFMLPGAGTTCYIDGYNNDVENNIAPTAFGDCWHTNHYINNYINVKTNTLLVGETTAYTSYDYKQNYHLKKPSLYPGYAGEGVGIYGGTVPFKEGGLPFNPHISQQTIAPKTDASENLNINIKVNAQNK